MTVFAPDKSKDWEPHKVTVPCCGDTIWSERPGQFKQCKCTKSYVDQTRYYIRLGGQACGLELPEELK